MKRILLLGMMVIAISGARSQAPLSSATLGLTLPCSSGTANRSGISYNPVQQLYYSVNAGNGSYPLETFDATGTLVNTNSAGFDYRGAWWNPNTNAFEGNGFNTLGIWEQSLNASGYAITGGINLLPATSGPDPQSAGNYDYVDNEILYYKSGVIYRHSRVTNTLITTVSITGLPVAVTNLNENSIAFTGIPGMEAGLYDHINKVFYFFNKLTGAYAASCTLPATAPAASRFQMGFANNYLWLYNSSLSRWEGYQTVSTCATTSKLTVTACKSYLSPAGNTYTSTGSYKDTLVNSASCDSVISITLTIINSVKGDTLHETACKFYTVPSGNMTYTSSGIYKDTLLSSKGCDSIFPIDLTLLQVNKTVTQTGIELFANNPNGTYQWVDCNENYQPVPGATNQQFIPTVNGDYAVLVTENSCTDTSECFSITTVGMATNEIAGEWNIYPNPANELLNIDFGREQPDGITQIISITGTTILQQRITGPKTILDVSSLSPGIFFIRVVTDQGIATMKWVKK